MLRMGLCFILIEAHSILPSPSGGFSTLLMLCSLFLRKVILLTMLAVNVFSSISKKKKQIANVIVRLRSFSYLFLNILKGITTQKDRTERLICLRQMKQKLYIGSRQNSLLPLKKLYFFVSTYLTIVQPSGGFSTLLMLCSLFLRKVILLTMLAVNVFSSISKKKKQIANVIVRLRSFSYLFLNILKGITTQKDRTERLICLRQMKQKLYIGSRQNSLLPLKKLYFFVSTYLTIVQGHTL